MMAARGGGFSSGLRDQLLTLGDLDPALRSHGRNAMADDHYMPILKGKRGEFDALSWSRSEVRNRLMPLIEVGPVPWDWGEDKPTKSLDRHLEDTAKRLAKSWDGERPILLDTIWLDPDDVVGDAHHLEYLLACTRDDMSAIPVGGLGRGDQHTAAVAAISTADQRGACLRLEPEDMEQISTLPTRIDAWLSVVDLDASEVDLLIDLWEMTSAGVGPNELAASVLLPNLHRLSDWRTLTLASGAFPKDLTSLDPDSQGRFPRLDWRLWERLRARDLPRHPAFGDYAIAHPELLDSDPRTLRPTASIRYSTPEYWRIVKRRWIQKGFDQFQTASSILMQHEDYRGDDHCQGDEFIASCAGGGKTGNLTTWRAVGTCHHLAVVAGQLSSSPGS
jgi:hypothetical protein